MYTTVVKKYTKYKDENMTSKALNVAKEVKM